MLTTYYFDMPLAFARQLAATYAHTKAVEAMHTAMADAFIALAKAVELGQANQVLFGPPVTPPVA